MLTQDNPCDDPRMKDWADLIDSLFAHSSPAWKIYEFGEGHHIQIIIALMDSAKLANARQALEKWGWKKYERVDEVESWFLTTHWRNPCQK